MANVVLDRPEHRLLDRREVRLDRIMAASNWKDGKFFNPSGASPSMGFGKSLSVMGEYFRAKSDNRVPSAALPMLSPLERWQAKPHTGLRSTWLGHSTTLLEIDGARVLTDPVFSERASPMQWVGPKRFHKPPVTLEQLPPLDAILISHDHYDHLDSASVARLAQLSTAPFVTALGVGEHLEKFGVPSERIIELAWWEQAAVPGTELTITATPAQHFSGRGALDRNDTLWASYVFAGPRHRAFFSGDTGLEPELARIRELHGPFDLVMLEVGAFHPLWGSIHLGPEQAMKAHEALGGGPFLPVHWSTFDLALHAWDEPIVTLEQSARDASFPLVAPMLGEVRDIVDLDDTRRSLARLDAWWRNVR